MAGVVAQFVPQATIVPVNIFAPFLAASTATATGGNTGGNNTGVTVTATSNTLTNSNFLYKGLNYVSTHPIVNDPVGPGASAG